MKSLHQQGLRAFAASMAGAMALLAGCASAPMVTDGTGKTMPVGEWAASWKEPWQKYQADRARAAGGSSTASGSTSAVAAEPTKPSIPAAVPGRSNEEWAAERGCRMLDDFILSTDVDTGYARAVRRFNLVSNEVMQRVAARGNDISMNYRHERQAGSSYLMAQRIKYPDQNSQTTRSMFVELALSKEGQKAVASVKYCVDPTQPGTMTVEHHRYVQKHLIAGLQNPLI